MQGVPAMPLRPSDEESELRATVSAMSRKLGPDYFQRVSSTGEPAREQLAELARAGFLGVYLSEEYGGGAGLTELSWVIEKNSRRARMAIVEEHDIVYREAAPSPVTGSPTQPAPLTRVEPTSSGACARWGRYADETFLFRFSALTYNAHRIHYDLAWAAHEGYAGAWWCTAHSRCLRWLSFSARAMWT
jgi:hypothetical protein